MSARWSETEIAALVSYYATTDASVFSLDAAAAAVGRPRIAVALKANDLGLTNISRPKTTIARKKMGERVRKQWAAGNHPRGMAGKKQTDKCRLAVSNANNRRWTTDKTFSIGLMSDAVRQARSDRMMARQANPTSGLRKGYSRGNQGRRADLGNQHFRSSWEANYARYLNWLQVKGDILRWEFEPDTFWFEAIKRGVRSYLPDFKVWDADGGQPYYVEVKGYMDAKSRTKLKRMKKYHPAVKVELFDAKRYKVLDRRMKNTLPGWEGGSVPVAKYDDEDTGAFVCEPS